MYIQTTALQKLLKLRKRIKAVQGGTSASKTISILQILIDKSQSDKTPKLTSVMSESMPHLKRGAMRDFLNIMQEHGYFKDERWNKTDFIYTFETGSKMEFFSLDMPHKVRGPRRHRGFINEANNNSKETFDQIEVRTEEELWLDWNPTAPFWFHDDGLENNPDVDFIILTYKDNEGLPASIVTSIEQRRSNKNWWAVYGEGKLGEVEGKIYTNWRIIDDLPFEARLERRGLDFGYSNDPAAIPALYYHNGGYILDEELYRKGMSNKDIADTINNLPRPQTLVGADAAEPKSIDELKLYGINVVAAEKGQGSVNQGIQYVQDQQISVTKRSVNLIKEYRSYMWKTDREGRILNVPEDMNNHLMDAIRYAFSTMNTKTDIHVYKPKAMLARKYG